MMRAYQTASECAHSGTHFSLILLVTPPLYAQAEPAQLLEPAQVSASTLSDLRVVDLLDRVTSGRSYEGHAFYRVPEDLSQTTALALEFDAPTGRLVAPGLGTVSLVADRTYASADRADGLAWSGSIRDLDGEGEYAGSVFLYTPLDGGVRGTIHVEGEVFRLESAGPGLGLLVAYDEGEFGTGADTPLVLNEGAAPDAPSETEQPRRHRDASPEPRAMASSSTTLSHRLLVVYTAAVDQEDRFSSSRDLVSEVQEEAAQTNAAYADSDVDEIMLDLVGIVQTTYDEGNDIGVDLQLFRNEPDVIALRDFYEADLVMLISDNVGGAGIAYSYSDVPEEGFSVVTWDALFNEDVSFLDHRQYVFAHEVGHNQGLNHHRQDRNGNDPDAPVAENDNDAYPYDYGFGWRYTDPDFWSADDHYATVMAYTPTAPDGDPYVRIPRFSNPDVIFDDQPTGQNNTDDNARVLENTGPHIASLWVDVYSVSITSSSPDAPEEGTYTFSAVTSGQESPATYAWYLSASPSNYGPIRSTSATFSDYLFPGTYYAKLVSQSDGGTSRTAYRTVTVDGDCTDQGPGSVCRRATPADEGPAETELNVGPNPVAGRAQVTVDLVVTADVDLAVFDALGRRVRTLASGPHEVGRTTLSLDATDLPAGLYVVRLVVDGVVTTRTVTVAR